MLLCALAAGAGCGRSGSQAEKASGTAAEPQPAIPPEITAAAKTSMGADAEVLAFGDLARNGHLEALVVNRLPKAPAGALPGLLVTRAGVLEKDGNEWKQLLLADEYLKNPNGFLAGTPLSAVPAWRLQYEQHADGLVLYFTPAERPPGGTSETIGVRYNPAAHRYQSLDREYKHFQGEASTISEPTYRIHP
jgi:hypothetical protein